MAPKANKSNQVSVKYSNMFAAYAAFWRRGFTEWAGTSSRSEYWWTVLVNFLITMAFSFLVGFTAGFGDLGGASVLDALSVIFGLVSIIPGISLVTRRLHDAGLSAWMWLMWILMLVPVMNLVLIIVWIVFMALPTKVDSPYHKNNKIR